MNKQEPLRGQKWLWGATHQAPRVPPKPPSASPLRHGAATHGMIMWIRVRQNQQVAPMERIHG